MKNKKETPVYTIRKFRCPNCESRNLKWEKWGLDEGLEEGNPWRDIQFSCCGDCHKIIPSGLAYYQYTYPSFEERKKVYIEKIKNSDYEPNWDKVFNHERFKPLNENNR